MNQQQAIRKSNDMKLLEQVRGDKKEMKIEVGSFYEVLSGESPYSKGFCFKVEDIRDLYVYFTVFGENGNIEKERLELMSKMIKEYREIKKGETPKPAHYDSSIDTIDFMRANCPPAELRGFMRGNVMKYITRFDKKGGLEDLRKCRHYLDMLIEEVEGEK